MGTLLLGDKQHFWGGSVTPVIWPCVGPGAHGLWATGQELEALSGVYKGEDEKQSQASKRMN